jgi:hypothetical protein
MPRNDKWKVFLELMMDNNTTMTAAHDEIVTMLIEKPAAIQRGNGLTPEALLFAKNSGKGSNGGNGGKASKANRSPKSDKRDNEDERKEKDFPEVLSLPAVRAHHPELLEQATWRSS